MSARADLPGAEHSSNGYQLPQEDIEAALDAPPVVCIHGLTKSYGTTHVSSLDAFHHLELDLLSTFGRLNTQLQLAGLQSVQHKA